MMISETSINDDIRDFLKISIKRSMMAIALSTSNDDELKLNINDE
jgi:hypothetical protein